MNVNKLIDDFATAKKFLIIIEDNSVENFIIDLAIMYVRGLHFSRETKFYVLLQIERVLVGIAINKEYYCYDNLNEHALNFLMGHLDCVKMFHCMKFTMKKK